MLNAIVAEDAVKKVGLFVVVGGKENEVDDALERLAGVLSKVLTSRNV